MQISVSLMRFMSPMASFLPRGGSFHSFQTLQKGASAGAGPPGVGISGGGGGGKHRDSDDEDDAA